MPLQRARGAESRVRNSSSNGPLRVQSNRLAESTLQRNACVKGEGCVGTLL